MPLRFLLTLLLATPIAAETRDRSIIRHAAPMLAATLTAARDHYGPGAKPLPPHIRTQLARYYTEADLAPVRYVVDQTGQTLPALINRAQLEAGETANHAVTIGPIIVFGTEPGPETSLYLWAHEVCHTLQYRRLGMEGFAAAYLADAAGIEAVATRAGRAAIRAALDPNATARLSHDC
ncbi:DUF4157 domain-containing protein [Aestuariibius insulae]|uniref:eCIS core domain-containing protein n=1 Tax=Aestuariibius insulae TaxID=2058287 RepID=UPI00345EF5FA